MADEAPKVSWEEYAAQTWPRVSDTGVPGDTDSGAGDGPMANEPPSPEPPPQREWTKPRGQLGEIHDAIETILGGIALGFFTAGDYHCYTVLAERGPLVAQVWTDAAKQNPQVKTALMRLIEGGQWGQIIFATASVAIPIMEHHGLWRLPNPWSILQTTPADYNPAAATAAAQEAFNDNANRGPFGPDEPEDVATRAERQRQAAEAARAQHHEGAT